MPVLSATSHYPMALLPVYKGKAFLSFTPNCPTNHQSIKKWTVQIIVSAKPSFQVTINPLPGFLSVSLLLLSHSGFRTVLETGSFGVRCHSLHSDYVKDGSSRSSAILFKNFASSMPCFWSVNHRGWRGTLKRAGPYFSQVTDTWHAFVPYLSILKLEYLRFIKKRE